MSRRVNVLGGRIGAPIGIALALAVFAGCDNNVALTSAPTSAPSASAAPTSAVVESPGASAAVSEAPASVAPSAEVSAAPTSAAETQGPTGTANPNPAIVSFTTPKQEDCTNASAGSVHVSWEVERASGVTIAIDGPGIYDQYDGLTGEIDLPFGCSTEVLKHTYTLKTVGGNGQWVSVTHTIRTRAPSIVSFTVGKPDCSGGDPYVGIPISFEIRAATGAKLDRDGDPYSTYNTKATDDIVMYDCSQNDQEWTLTTTGGYGPAATRSIKVSKN